MLTNNGDGDTTIHLTGGGTIELQGVGDYTNIAVFMQDYNVDFA